MVPLGVSAEDLIVFKPPPADLAEDEEAASSSVVLLVTAAVFRPVAVELLSSAHVCFGLLNCLKLSLF